MEYYSIFFAKNIICKKKKGKKINNFLRIFLHMCLFCTSNIYVKRKTFIIRCCNYLQTLVVDKRASSIAVL